MELYGGGITGEPTNYQIGGAVSRAKISSKYLGDYKKVKDAHDENIKNMGFWSNVGDIGSFIANLVLPGSGGVVKAGAESLYRPEDVGDIDFALGQEEKATDISDAYRRGIVGRGAMSSLSAMLMPEIYGDLGEKAKVGLGKLGSSKVGQSIPMDILGEQAAREYGVGGKDFAKQVSERAYQDMPWLKEEMAGNIDLMDFLPQPDKAAIPSMTKAAIPSMTKAAIPSFNQSMSKADLVGLYGPDYWMYQKRGGQIPQMRGGGPTDDVIPQYQYGGNMQFGDRQKNQFMPQQNQFMPQQNQFMPQTQEDSTPDLTPDLSNTDFSALSGGMDLGLFKGADWSGLYKDTLGWGEGSRGSTTPPITKKPGSAGTFSPYGDYGKQRGVAGALTAAGMGDKMKDPEFAKYMKYLPTFDMGYEQKIADYRTGAQGSLFGMTAPMGAGETTFAGSGAVKKARETGRKQTTDIYGRQERGVGEEYIKDVLAGLTAAETARETPFEAPSGDDDNSKPPDNPQRTDIDGQMMTHNGRKWRWSADSQWWVDEGAAG